MYRYAWLADLGGAFGGAVESGAAEEKVDLLPGFTTGLFHMQETLDLWTRPRPQQVLRNTSGSFFFLPKIATERMCLFGKTRTKNVHCCSTIFFLSVQVGLWEIISSSFTFSLSLIFSEQMASEMWVCRKLNLSLILQHIFYVRGHKIGMKNSLNRVLKHLRGLINYSITRKSVLVIDSFISQKHFCFQLIKPEDLLRFSVLYLYKLDVFGFGTFGRTKQNKTLIGSFFTIIFTFY